MKKRDITDAMKKTIAKHKNPVREVFMFMNTCHLCNIVENDCEKCPYGIISAGCEMIFNKYEKEYNDLNRLMIAILPDEFELITLIQSTVPLLEKHLKIIERTVQADLPYDKWITEIQEKINKCIE